MQRYDMRIFGWIFTLALSFCPLTAMADSAFGTKIGGELPSGAEQSGFNIFHQFTPVKAHSLFEDYYLVHSETYGVCIIIGYSAWNEDDRYGTRAKSDYERIKSVLNKKYGKGETLELLKSGALWDKADEFSRSLKHNDRYHETTWFLDASSKEKISTINLRILAPERDKTLLAVNYSSGKFSECVDEANSSDDDAL